MGESSGEGVRMWDVKTENWSTYGLRSLGSNHITNWVQISDSRLFILTESSQCFELLRSRLAQEFIVTRKAAPSTKRRCFYSLCGIREELLVITGGCGGLQGYFKSCESYKID